MIKRNDVLALEFCVIYNSDCVQQKFTTTENLNKTQST